MTKIRPFIKWAGGKENELPIILANLPSNFSRYVEPFVGGGAVYLNIGCTNSVINDKSDELMLLYKMIKTKNKDILSEKLNSTFKTYTISLDTPTTTSLILLPRIATDDDLTIRYIID